MPPGVAHAGQQTAQRAHQPPGPAAPGGLAGLGFVLQGAQQARAHHGRGGEGNQHGNQHRRGQHYGKLAEQSPHNAAHEHDGREHRHQRKRNGNHGKAHFARAAQGCAQGFFARFQPTHDVFQHHDGVVHHKACGNGEGHERKIVQAVAAEVHDAEGAQQGYGRGHGGDSRGPAVAQKKKGHQHHQGHGQKQAFFHLVQGGADGLGAIHAQLQIRAFGQPGAQLWQERLNMVHSGDDVGAGRAEDDQQHRRSAVGKGHGAHVLRAVLHPGHVGQANGFVAPAGHDDVFVVLRFAQLVVSPHQPEVFVAFQHAAGQKGVGPGQGLAHVFHDQAGAAQGVRGDLHPHGGQGPAPYDHFAHAGQL